MISKEYYDSGRKKIDKRAFWNRAALFVLNIDVYEWNHSMPTNPKALRRKYNRYIDEGYQSIVHDGHGNKKTG
jgi:hypothetical protein